MDSDIRYRAIDLLEAGTNQKEVARRFGKGVRTIIRWWFRFKQNYSLTHRKGAGRPKKMNMAAKMVIVKSLGKRHHSTRKLSTKLKLKGYQISKSTVHNYLRNQLAVKAFKRPKKPKLTQNQMINRHKFCKKVKNWTVHFKVMCFDESLFELFHSSNTQNDRIWAHSTQDVLPRETIKNPPKIMVWSMMSYRGLSDLHFIPPKQTVNALYYVSDILEGTVNSA